MKFCIDSTSDTKFFGRRRLLFISYCIAGATIIASVVLNEISFCVGGDLSNPVVLTSFILSTTGKFAITSSFGIIYNYTTELFPTCVRANAIGVCSMFSRTAGMLSPVISDLYDKVSWLPGSLFGGIAVIAAILTLMLPETRGKPLIMTFEDAQNLYDDREIGSSNYYENEVSEDSKQL